MKLGLHILGIPLIAVSATKGEEGDALTLDGVKKLGAAVKKGVHAAADKVASKTEEAGKAVKQGVHNAADKVAASTESSDGSED